MPTVTASEQFVLDVCRKSFLSLWCYNNPKRHDNDELCDILVVCDPHVVIISVKDITYRDTGNYEVDSGRWERRAIDGSLRQIHGAQRWLETADRVIQANGRPGLALPPMTHRKTHRLAVAFGAGENPAIIKSGNLGDGYTSVMTDQSFHEVLGELDTITDFVNYLQAKEERAASGSTSIIMGPESNLLGFYLGNGRSFPSGQTVMMIDESIWEHFQNSPEFKRRKEADKDSYIWDDLIECFAKRAVDEKGFDPQIVDIEKALRLMSRESRLSRRALSKGLNGFLDLNGKARSRILGTLESPIAYVLVAFRGNESDQQRNFDLCDRCLAARSALKHAEVFIGIGFVGDGQGQWFPADLAGLDTREWSADDRTEADSIQANSHYYAASKLEKFDEVEYPPIRPS